MTVETSKKVRFSLADAIKEILRAAQGEALEIEDLTKELQSRGWQSQNLSQPCAAASGGWSLTVMLEQSI